MVYNVIQHPNNEMKQMLPPISRRIAQTVTDIVTVAEMLKGKGYELYLFGVLSG